MGLNAIPNLSSCVVQCDGVGLFMVFFFCMQTEEEPDVVLVKVEEGTRQTSLSIQEGELTLTATLTLHIYSPTLVEVVAGVV